jgi:cytochrome b
MSETSAQTISSGDTPQEMVRVWDPFVRIFHWSLVILFAAAFLTGDESKRLHLQIGYVVAGLVAARVIWGLIGTRHARFSDFIYAPGTTIGFLFDTMRLKARRYLGHNPLGGLMVIVLLIAIAGICTTGYMMTTDAFWGIEWVEETHEALVYGTLVLVALHVAGVIFASVEHSENLVRSMVTGLKRRK